MPPGADSPIAIGRLPVSRAASPAAIAAPRTVALRTRLALGLLGTLALVVAAFTVFTLRVSDASRRDLDDIVLSTQAQMLRAVVARQQDGATATARSLAADPAFTDLVARRDTAAITRLLASFANSKPDIVLLSVVDAQDRPLGLLRPGASPDTAAGTSGLADRGKVLPGVNRLGDELYGLAAAAPVKTVTGGTVATLTVGVGLAATLAELENTTGSGVLLLDSRGGRIAASNPGVSGTASDQADNGATGVRSRSVGEHSWTISTVPLLDGAGARLGTEVQVRDTTDVDGRRSFVTAGAVLLLASVLGMAALLAFLAIDRIFRPLAAIVAALSALTAGNTDIELAGEERQDEIGQVARFVRVLRDRARERGRQRLRLERGQRRQHRFIRQQMAEMGAALATEAGTDASSDTESVEDALAKLESGQAVGGEDDLGVLALAFRITARRVIAQHGRLDALVGELQESLQARTELIGLQQQFSFASTMQAGLLPQALPPRPDVQARGGLLPAREFGGDFYDFFPLGPAQLAVIAGTAGGAGLQSAFLTLTARTLLKAVLVCGVMPAAAMARVNALLRAEEGGDAGVAALVMVLDIGGSRVTCCNAGYPNPLLLRRLGDAASLPLPAGPALGTLSVASYVETRFDIAPRTTLVTYSPGFGPDDEARLLAVLAGCLDPAAEAVLNAMMSAASHRRNETVSDASCVVVRYAAAA